MANKKNLRKVIIISAVIVILIAAAGYYLLDSPKDEKNNFRFVKVEKGNIESLVSSTGVINPVITVQVGSQVSGTIARIFTDFNHKVKKGDLVALIDTTFLAASVRDAQSSVEKAKAQYDQSVRDLDRIQTLVQKNLSAKTDLETAQYNAAVAKANLRSAQAQLDRARINLKYASITAPISGTVIARNVDVGQTVAASLSAPTLFLIANDLSQMQIIANVDESDIGQIQNGQKVTFTVQAYPDKTFEGIVQQIRLQPTTIQNVVNYSVVINVNNNLGLLLPGMTATIQFQISHAEDVLKVPNAALRLRPTQEMIAEARSSFGQKAGAGKRDSTRNGNGSFSHSQYAAEGGNGQNGGGSPSFNGQSAPNGTRRNATMLWYLDNNGKLNAARVKTGLTDGQYTEIISERIHEGMEVISGILSGNEPKGTTPFQNPSQNRNMGGRRGF